MNRLAVAHTRLVRAPYPYLLVLPSLTMHTVKGNNLNCKGSYRDEAIARIVGLEKKRAIPSHRDLREKMPRMRRGSEKLIREDRNAR